MGLGVLLVWSVSTCCINKLAVDNSPGQKARHIQFNNDQVWFLRDDLIQYAILFQPGVLLRYPCCKGQGVKRGWGLGYDQKSSEHQTSQKHTKVWAARGVGNVHRMDLWTDALSWVWPPTLSLPKFLNSVVILIGDETREVLLNNDSSSKCSNNI